MNFLGPNLLEVSESKKVKHHVKDRRSTAMNNLWCGMSLPTINVKLLIS